MTNVYDLYTSTINYYIKFYRHTQNTSKWKLVVDEGWLFFSGWDEQRLNVVRWEQAGRPVVQHPIVQDLCGPVNLNQDVPDCQCQLAGRLCSVGPRGTVEVGW